VADHGARVGFVLNGSPATVAVRGDETLLETLRDRCACSSVRYCCGIGVCGTCTVLVDGEPLSSCLLLTSMVAGRPVTTAEGLSAAGELSAVQREFVAAGAYQCSYCIPAAAVTIHGYLQRNPGAGEDDVREVLAGNLCRCGSYPQVMAAVRALVRSRMPAAAGRNES
jgi:aerobic-type carbon monoxide dehydrogenase small subunit (CoxS/CutS family)